MRHHEADGRFSLLCKNNTDVKFSRELNRLLIHFPLFSLFSGQAPSREHALGIVIKTPSLCV